MSGQVPVGTALMFAILAIESSDPETASWNNGTAIESARAARGRTPHEVIWYRRKLAGELGIQTGSWVQIDLALGQGASTGRFHDKEWAVRVGPSTADT